MTRFLLYIALLGIPAGSFAQNNSGDVTITTEDTAASIVIDTFVENDYDEDYIQEAPKQAAEPLPPPVYTQRKFKDKFQDKYKDNDDFDYSEKPEEESLLQRILRAIARFFDNLFGSSKSGSGDGLFLLWFFRILAVGLVLTAVYFIVRAILKKEGVWIFGRSSKKISPLSEEEGQNIHEMDFNVLTATAVDQNDYRLAVRYYYLWLLKRLSARGIIDWNWDKTNTDYYYEIKDNNLRDDFKYLSYVYDYCWYGEFEIDSEAFSKAEKAFKKTLNSL